MAYTLVRYSINDIKFVNIFVEKHVREKEGKNFFVKFSVSKTSEEISEEARSTHSETFADTIPSPLS